ncbi:Zn-dependent hydrolase [Acidiphilium sp. AL]|uniref:Zn-dependent hydrolase n=1 Tax=Acidiphilium iwatense TaxID=768198 RepID=A0ABS9DQV2_9PROT|nr:MULTISPECIES: Zn-dependent hydrolase [Acidiphilium]MCF3945124.1 Zn-dependent hydrolase [Acidiphilium iwatense]MCU4160531.1 Zn-dependent hydrolase [Acidiphilium sp. AL]
MNRDSNYRIDGKRLWGALMAMAEIGATPKGGVNRVTLTEVDRAGRARFAEWCGALGLSVRADSMGNMFARREGRDPARKPVLFGSHLDSQPTGGKFDGALGVIAGLEVMRALNELGIVTEAPLELVNWTDEEGCRFGRAMMGSAVWAGVHDEQTIKALRDADGVSVGEALTGIGAAGSAPARAFAADAYFELHIEQGPILEREAKTIGIVTGAQAQIWFDAVLRGRESHAGTTPPDARRDALAGAAEIILLVEATMRERGDAGRGTVGRLTVHPNSPNVIPGEVRFAAEFRHPDDAAITTVASRFPEQAAAIAQARGLDLSLTPVFRVAATEFDPGCVALVRDACARLGYPAREMVSGAGHDAVHVAPRVPTAMIFTPCKDGLSHNEAESITEAEAAAGAQVLLDVVLARANR